MKGYSKTYYDDPSDLRVKFRAFVVRCWNSGNFYRWYSFIGFFVMLSAIFGFAFLRNWFATAGAVVATLYTGLLFLDLTLLHRRSSADDDSSSSCCSGMPTCFGCEGSVKAIQTPHYKLPKYHMYSPASHFFMHFGAFFGTAIGIGIVIASAAYGGITRQHFGPSSAWLGIGWGLIGVKWSVTWWWHLFRHHTWGPVRPAIITSDPYSSAHVAVGGDDNDLESNNNNNNNKKSNSRQKTKGKEEEEEDNESTALFR